MILLLLGYYNLLNGFQHCVAESFIPNIDLEFHITHIRLPPYQRDLLPCQPVRRSLAMLCNSRVCFFFSFLCVH